MKGVPADFLNDFELGADGQYRKKKTVLQPREKVKEAVKVNAEHKHPSYPYPPLIIFRVDAMGKPRMTQSDKWKKRDATDRFWELKRFLKAVSEVENFTMPESDYHMIFCIKMPDSWPVSKKEEMNGKPHQQKPDKDNLEKGVLDSLCKEDCTIYDGRVSKYWAYSGQIFIYKLP